MRPTMRTRGFTRRPRPTIACTIRRRIRGSASSSTDGAAAAASDARSAVVADEALDRGGDRGDVARRHEQAVLPVADDLRDPADRRRDHRRSRGERLEQRVREVLPGGGQERRVGGAEERDHVVARPGAEEADAIRRARARRRDARAPPAPGPSPRTSSSTPGTRASASSASSSAFCAVSRPAMPSAEPVDAERRARLVARRVRRHARAPGSGRRSRAPGRGPSRARSRGGTRSARRPGARDGARRCASRAANRTRSPPRCAWNCLERAVEPAGAPLPLVRLVGDELDDERPPRERRAERGTAHHRRRVDAVGAAGRAPHLAHDRQVTERRGPAARRPSAPGTAAARAPGRRSSPPRPCGPPRAAPSASAGA